MPKPRTKPRTQAQVRDAFRWYRPLLAMHRMYADQPHPPQPILCQIGEFTKGTKTQNQRSGEQAREGIYHFVEQRWPKDDWIIRTYTRPETWSHVELWAEYRGEWPDAEMALKARKERAGKAQPCFVGGRFMDFRKYRAMLAQSEASG